MGFIGKAIGSVFKAVKKVVTGVLGFATKIVGSIFGFGVKQPKATSAVNNLNKSLDPETNRKIVFGKIAAPLDVRFWEVWGSNGNKFDEVLAIAGHRINGVYEFYAEEKLAINAAGTVQSRFSGVLSRSVKLGEPGQTALSAGSGALWTSASKFTGVAHIKLSWKVDEKKLPDGAPSRYTQVVEGALVYDPRRDSTVPGGSGTHRANDQTTWSFATLDGNGVPIGRNNALQALWYLLGWRYLPDNRIADQNLNNWGQASITVGAQDASGFYPLTDSSASVDGYVSYGASTNFANGDVVTIFAKIKKDNVYKTTRFPTIQVSDNTGWMLMSVDTSTGEFKAETFSSNPIIDANVADGGDHWLARMTFKAVGAGSCPIYIKPAYGAGATLGSASAALSVQGTTSFKDIGKYFGNFDNPNGHLTCGRGIIPEDINMASFIAGANACETAGYYTDMCLSTGDDHSANEAKITCDGLIGRLIDPGGLWSYYANVNDTASIAVELTDADITDEGSVSWNEYAKMADQFNQVGGKFINPSSITLYQPFAYPLVRDATYEANLGVKKRRTQDFDQVLDNTLAQRLARLKLNSAQYQGEFKASWNMRGLKAQAWSVVRYTSERFGWTKYFRVWRQEVNMFSGVAMTLREIDPSIWSAGTVNNAITPEAGVNNDPLAQYAVLGLSAMQTSLTGGSPAITQDGVIVSWTQPPEAIAQTEVRYRLVGATVYQYTAPITRSDVDNVLSITIFPLIRGSNYEIQCRHVSVYGIEGPWATIASFTAGNAGNIVTANAPVLGSIDPVTGRIINPTMYNTGQIIGIPSTTNLAVTYTVGASNVTVNIPAHVRKVASPTGPLTLNYAAGSFVVPFSSYWIAYIDDADLNGDAAPVYVKTTLTSDLLWPNRYFVASGTSPAAGGSGGSSGGGGGGGFGDCVAADSFMPNGDRACEVKVGDMVWVLNEDNWDGVKLQRVNENKLALAPCVELVSSSGIELVLSASTPCTLRGGETVLARDVKGEFLGVHDNGYFRWEKIVSVKDVGKRIVAHISCDNKTYAAGAVKGRFIFTHNTYQKP